MVSVIMVKLIKAHHITSDGLIVDSRSPRRTYCVRRSTRQIQLTPSVNCVVDAESNSQTVKQNLNVDRVECCCLYSSRRTSAAELPRSTACMQDVRQYSQNSSFSRIFWKNRTAAVVVGLDQRSLNSPSAGGQQQRGVRVGLPSTAPTGSKLVDKNTHLWCRVPASSW